MEKNVYPSDSMVLRDAEPEEKNKSKEGFVILEGKVLKVPYLPFETANELFYAAVQAVSNIKEKSPAKEFLNECIKATHEELKNIKYSKDKDMENINFINVLSQEIIKSSEGRDLETVPAGLMMAAIIVYASMHEKS
jgi:hypothetical protein